MHIQQPASTRTIFERSQSAASSDPQALSTSLQDGTRNIPIELLSITDGSEQKARIRETASGIEYDLPLRSPIDSSDALLSKIESGDMKLARLTSDNGKVLVATEHRLGLRGGVFGFGKKKKKEKPLGFKNLEAWVNSAPNEMAKSSRKSFLDGFDQVARYNDHENYLYTVDGGVFYDRGNNGDVGLLNGLDIWPDNITFCVSSWPEPPSPGDQFEALGENTVFERGGLHIDSNPKFTRFPNQLTFGRTGSFHVTNVPVVDAYNSTIEGNGHVKISHCKEMERLPNKIVLSNSYPGQPYNLEISFCPKIVRLPENMMLEGNLIIRDCPRLIITDRDRDRIGGDIIIDNLSSATQVIKKWVQESDNREDEKNRISFLKNIIERGVVNLNRNGVLEVRSNGSPFGIGNIDSLPDNIHFVDGLFVHADNNDFPKASGLVVMGDFRVMPNSSSPNPISITLGEDFVCRGGVNIFNGRSQDSVNVQKNYIINGDVSVGEGAIFLGDNVVINGDLTTHNPASVIPESLQLKGSLEVLEGSTPRIPDHLSHKTRIIPKRVERPSSYGGSSFNNSIYNGLLDQKIERDRESNRIINQNWWLNQPKY